MSNQNRHKQGYKHTPLGWIPEEWEVLTIEELLDRNIIVSHLDGNHGGLYPRAEEFVSSGVPYLSANKFFNGYVDFKGCKYLHPDRAKQFRKGIAKNGDVLFAHNATVGPVAILETDLDYVVLSTTATYFRCNDNELSNLYLREYFTSYYFINQYSRVMGQSTRNQVPITTQRTFYTILPKLPEQRQIASILSTWDEAITKTQQLIAKLQQRNRGLMQQLLTAKHDWKEYRIGDLLKEVKRPVDWNDEELYHLISVRRRSGGAFFRESLYGKQILTKQLFTAEAGDFLISKMQIVHGASAVVPPEFAGMKISGSYIAVHAKNENVMDINFFNWLSKTKRFYKLTYISSYGVHIEKMTFDFDDFKHRKIMLPPTIEEQKSIVKILQTATEEVKLQEQKLAGLQQQKKGLMQKLLTGEVRVKFP